MKPSPSEPTPQLQGNQPHHRWQPMQGWRLSSRMVGLSLLLLLAVQALAFVAIRGDVERNARAALAAELKVGERVWTGLLEQRATKLGQGAALLAADFGFRSAVASNDQATVASALENHGARINAARVALLDTRFAVRAQSPAPTSAQTATSARDSDLSSTLSALAPQLAQQGALVAVVAGKPYQFVMVPLRAPVLVGWVLMGFELDGTVVDDLYAVAGLKATLVVLRNNAAPTVARSSWGTNLTPADLAALAALPLGAGEIMLQGSTHLAHTLPVSAGDSPQQLRVSLTGSLDQAVAPYQALQLTLAALTLLGLLLFGLGSAWLARRVTQPLQQLVQASERLGQGDYETPLQMTGRQDEIDELAKAFEHMRLNVGQQQREIRQLAYWDRLTSLPNRAQFLDLARAAALHGQPMAVLMLDLDRFKHVNDVLGYAFGDRLLQGVAQRLCAAVRPGDVVARLGGDEFVLLLPGATAALAQQVAQRIAAAFETPITLDDQRVDLSAGMGIACFPQHASAAEALLNHAEVAMYAAKKHGSGAQLYEAALDSSSAQTLSLLSELRHAVENNELRLYLQPKVLLADGSLCGAEGLVRWQHPQRGLVPPMQFIPFAEQTGYVRQLTLWVFEEGARLQSVLQAMGVRRLSINLSTRDLLDLELPEKLDALLMRHGARAAGFCLEITESAIMDDPQRAEATLNRLHQRGYKLSIDDFGTGYSSLAYLKRLPVQELKIDRSFVMGMQTPAAGATQGNSSTKSSIESGTESSTKSDTQIVRSTIDLAHNLGLSVVAEGVEDAATLQQLRTLGCDEAQGYHLSKPVTLADLQLWAARWKSEQALPYTAAVPAASPSPAVEPAQPGAGTGTGTGAVQQNYAPCPLM